MVIEFHCQIKANRNFTVYFQVRPQVSATNGKLAVFL